ncbi:hypothetical protein KGA66_16470 [Actinocrinis puniceicyclus]|uniref:Uncharacterized protein n=1 Tax=Actinocrinis puniceicyclus TaxID=977794 RepID=A0A8J7WNP7_9ACTN|nr:hypothetical protein [Actinocrinis puniceicyclus]MBS2964653.1 hypothetical protein [Actinocrinis puniceicyclus]
MSDDDLDLGLFAGTLHVGHYRGITDDVTRIIARARAADSVQILAASCSHGTDRRRQGVPTTTLLGVPIRGILRGRPSDDTPVTGIPVLHHGFTVRVSRPAPLPLACLDFPSGAT